MYFQSTRSSDRTDGKNAVLLGIAPDGGLYTDPDIGKRPFDWKGCLALSPPEMAEKLLSHMLPDFQGMREIVIKSYKGKFPFPQLTPLVRAGEDYVLELFHGPTCSFKDIALSVLPRLMAAAKGPGQGGNRILILTATSGDTGIAALEGFRDVNGMGIVVFYPADGVSPVQKAQMVCQRGKNIHVCGVRGNFDDCQSGVKNAFAEINAMGLPAEKGFCLSSANSINIGRLVPQVTYYFAAYASLVRQGRIKTGNKVDFSVPTGNFGDILAGYLAKLLGLPVGTLICASNMNNVLTDFIKTGVYDRRRHLIKTSSPSMDILISSNVERLLFLASGGDTGFVGDCMRALSDRGVYKIEGDVLASIRDSFAAFYCDEEKTARTINKIWRRCSYLCDTHTAAAFSAAGEYKAKNCSERPMVILSTASPYKFPAAVLAALGEGAETVGEGGKPEEDDFSGMERLARISGTPIPKALLELRGRKTLHRDVIEKDEILSYVLKTISGCEDKQ